MEHLFKGMFLRTLQSQLLNGQSQRKKKNVARNCTDSKEPKQYSGKETNITDQ